MSFGVEFGALIRERRGIEGMTQQELAVKAFGEEARKSRISELENGRVENPHQKTVDALVLALNISDDEIRQCQIRAKQKVLDAERYQLPGPLADIFVNKALIKRARGAAWEFAKKKAPGVLVGVTAADPVMGLSIAGEVNRAVDRQAKIDKANAIIEEAKARAAEGEVCEIEIEWPMEDGSLKKYNLTVKPR